MRVNRRFLYWGTILVAIGGVLVAADLGAVDTPTLTDALRLWPLAIVAIGLSLVLRRTRLSLPALMLAAAVPGLVVGGALAVAPRFAGACGARGEPAGVTTTQGAFDGPASVSVRSGCGSLNVTTAAGSGWQLNAGNTAGRTPNVDSSPRSLSIDGTSHDGNFFDAGRDAWSLTLPTSDLADLSFVVFAGRARIDLPGAHVDGLAMTVNAAEMVVDASAASVTDVSAVVNVGSLSLRLPAGSDLSGSLRVGGGQLLVCSAPGVGLHVTTRGTAKQVTVDGLRQTESEWQSLDYSSAAHRVDLSVNVNFGTVEINPIGGCK
jgi:phage baseplate assembly protein gpV